MKNGLEAIRGLQCGYMDGEKVMITRKGFDINISIIEKYIKAFEIIKSKKVNANQLIKSKSLWSYNKRIVKENRQLTQEEFDLLKEVLK